VSRHRSKTAVRAKTPALMAVRPADRVVDGFVVDDDEPNDVTLTLRLDIEFTIKIRRTTRLRIGRR